MRRRSSRCGAWAPAGAGRLELFQADLLRPGSFDAAINGCRYVFHVASPFLLPEQIKSTGTDVIKPAVEGTKNIITSIGRAPGVERLVLTSTVGAIRSRHPRRVLIPRHRLPDAAVRVLGPRFGLTPDYIAKHLGISFAVDNHRSFDELGLVYRSVRETMLDHYESWRARRARPR